MYSVRGSPSTSLEPPPLSTDQSANADALVWAGVGDRAAVLGADDDGIGNAVEFAVADDELDEVLAGFVGGEARRDGEAVDQAGEAAERMVFEGPGVAQRVAVRVGRSGTAELDRVADLDRLVGSGVGERRLVDGAALGARCSKRMQARTSPMSMRPL
jgi:hypothetical protein